MNSEQRIKEICASHSDREGPLLLILGDVQSELGHIDQAAETIIASELNLTRAEVHGVVSFYHDFQSAPEERPVVQICRAEACKARGVESMMDKATVEAGERVKLETVYCLGLCSTGPNARIGDQLYSRLDAEALRKLVRTA